ncbi:MAG: ABC transporter substrate-binding protein [Thermomicrobiales bacterium]
MVSLHKQPLSRRTMFKGGAAGASAFAFPTFFSSSRARAQETLSFWQFYAPGGQVATQGSWFEEMVNAWNEQNDVKVELNYVPVQDYLGGATLQTAFASGEGPDIFIISPGDFLRYYNGGVLADLTPYMDQAAIDDFYPDVLASRMVDGKVYGLPMEVEPLAMYYDPAAWEDAGLSDADIPQTWEQLLAVAEQLTTGDRFGVLFEQSPGYYQNFTWYPFMWMGGAEIVHEDGVTSGLRDEGAVQALKFWQDTISAEVAPRESLGTGGGDAAANLATGYCAMQQTGIWALAALRENAPDFEFGLFKLPTPPNGAYSTDLGGWAFVANAQGRNPEAAAQFCVWALGSMEADSVQRVVDWCTKAKSDMPPRQSVLENEEAQAAYAEGHMNTFAEEIFLGGRAEPRVTPEIYKAISDAIQATQLDGADPSQAGETAAQQIESFLATYEGAPIL